MTDLFAEAMQTFREIRERVKTVTLNEPDAMTVATCDSDGVPTARVVLLRGFDERGFAFYTNSDSRKGQQLNSNPQAAICMYWDGLGEQVRIEGPVEQVSDEESDNYWNNRPRMSRIASAASLQSQELADRRDYERRVAELAARYPGDDIPRPESWHGYRVVPRRIEFWKNRENRMHERTVYEWRDDEWVKYGVYP